MRFVLLVAALAALALPPPAQANLSVVVGHGEAGYLGHDVGVLTADFVAMADPTDPTWTLVRYTCTAEAPQTPLPMRCVLRSDWFGEYESHEVESVTPFALISATARVPDVYLYPEEAQVCTYVVGTSMPPACTRIVFG